MKPLPFHMPKVRGGLTVRYGDQDETALGHFDPEAHEVVIREGEQGVGLHVLLLHEFMHVVEHALLATGVTLDPVEHAFIEQGSPLLLYLLAEAGMIAGLTGEDVRRWHAEQAPDPTPDVRQIAEGDEIPAGYVDLTSAQAREIVKLAEARGMVIRVDGRSARALVTKGLAEHNPRPGHTERDLRITELGKAVASKLMETT